MHTRGPQTFCGIAAVLAGLVACGSSYTKADFIRQADAICQTAFRQARAIPPPATTAADPRLAGLADYVDRVIPIAQAQADQLRRLRRPAQDRPLLDRYLTALAAAVGDYRALAAAAKRKDAAGVTRGETALTSSRVDSLAKRYGLRSCGSAGATTA